MFFLITHLVIGKYYPSFYTQFIIGCTFYIISFLILKEFITNRTYDHYKSYAFTLIAVDISFLVYQSRISQQGNEFDIEKIHKQEKSDVQKIPQQEDTGRTSAINSTINSTINSAINSAINSTSLPTTTDPKHSVRTVSLQSLTMSSESNDIRITHDLSSSDDKADYNLFSLSEEKKSGKNSTSDERSIEKVDE